MLEIKDHQFIARQSYQTGPQFLGLNCPRTIAYLLGQKLGGPGSSILNCRAGRFFAGGYQTARPAFIFGCSREHHRTHALDSLTHARRKFLSPIPAIKESWGGQRDGNRCCCYDLSYRSCCDWRSGCCYRCCSTNRREAPVFERTPVFTLS